MKKKTLKENVIITMSMAKELHSHVPVDVRGSIQEGVDSLISQVRSRPSANESVLQLEATLQELSDRLRTGLNKYYGKPLDMVYSPSENEDNEVA